MSEMEFIGLGSMGLAMAKNLAQDATTLRVWNRTASKADAMTGKGVRRSSSPAKAAEAGIVVSMVADDRALEEIVGGPEGILAAARPGLHISMSTVSPAVARTVAARLAEKGGLRCRAGRSAARKHGARPLGARLDGPGRSGLRRGRSSCLKAGPERKLLHGPGGGPHEPKEETGFRAERPDDRRTTGKPRHGQYRRLPAIVRRPARATGPRCDRAAVLRPVGEEDPGFQAKRPDPLRHAGPDLFVTASRRW